MPALTPSPYKLCTFGRNHWSPLGEVYHDSKNFYGKSWAKPSFSKLEGETHHVHSSPGDLLPQLSLLLHL